MQRLPRHVAALVAGQEGHALRDLSGFRGPTHGDSYEFTLFRDMPHGWLNSTMPGRYREKEAAEAWRLIVGFLGRVFSGEFPPDRARWQFQSDIAASYDFSKNVRLE